MPNLRSAKCENNFLCIFSDRSRTMDDKKEKPPSFWSAINFPGSQSECVDNRDRHLARPVWNTYSYNIFDLWLKIACLEILDWKQVFNVPENYRPLHQLGSGDDRVESSHARSTCSKVFAVQIFSYFPHNLFSVPRHNLNIYSHHKDC